MNSRTFKLSLAVLAIFLVTLACEFSFSSAKVENLRLARDEAGQQTTTQFVPTDTFYLVGDLSNAPDDTLLKAVWTAVAAEGVDPNLVIQERELSAPTGPFWFSLVQDSGVWPAGSYKVDLYLNDELNQSLGFQVVAPPEAQVQPTAPPQPAAPTEPAAGEQPTISNFFTALDEAGQQPSSNFAQASKIYTVFTLAAGESGANVKGSLTATAAEGIAPDTLITELEQGFASGQNLFTFENTTPWPKGAYRIDLALEGQPVGSLEIQVVSTNTSGAVVTQAYSALDEQGQQQTVTFPVDSAVYIHFTLENAPDDTVVKGVMVAVEAEGQEPYSYVTEAGSNLGSGSYWFQFTNNGPWPVGSYAVFIYLNGELAGQVDLQVQ
jgi:hypothetical protein